MYVFKGSPDFSETPCPGGVALGNDGSCPGFTCENDDSKCLNGGTCNANNPSQCDCATVGSAMFSGIDCALYECSDDNTGNSLRGIVNWSGAAWSAT